MLSQRVAKARSIVKAGLVKQDSPTKFWVPGSKGTINLVTRRKNELTYHCQKIASRSYIPCPGNSNGYLCYHVFQAIIVGAKTKGHKVSFCKNEKDAERLSHLGGTLYKVRSGQGSGKVWVVIS